MEKTTHHILIVDDDPFLTEMYTLSLTQPDVHVDTAHDGKQALEMIEQKKPDLLLLDLLMPIMDGFAVLTELKKRGHAFPIIVLSNIAVKEEQQRCIDLGATDFFPKGETDLVKLQEKVKKYL